MCTCETKACSLRQCQHCTTNKSASSTRMNQSPQKNRAGREQALPTRWSLQKGEEQLLKGSVLNNCACGRPNDFLLNTVLNHHPASPQTQRALHVAAVAN